MYWSSGRSAYESVSVVLAALTDHVLTPYAAPKAPTSAKSLGSRFVGDRGSLNEIVIVRSPAATVRHAIRN